MKTTKKYAIALVTAKNKREGRKIAEEILRENLAACVTIVNGCESVYVWKGKTEKSSEVLLIIKTKMYLSKRLMIKIKQIHSYDVPEIIFVPIISGYADYLSWIDESVSSKK
ncbi:MAG: Divalent-cation tolerance protein CutA [Elusimicrobia bacterium ADurb.Bin231]|nr:MAG: Divalent-cation tolerance protein CutA [Elusimicrobia bacterium ADurb.Bin231]